MEAKMETGGLFPSVRRRQNVSTIGAVVGIDISCLMTQKIGHCLALTVVNWLKEQAEELRGLTENLVRLGFIKFQLKVLKPLLKCYSVFSDIVSLNSAKGCP